MPELPEVELVARHLRELIFGRTFVKAKLLRAGLAPEISPRQFAAALKGARVTEVTRRGKHILTHLSNGRTWLTHLRMTGRFFYLDEHEQNIRHTHAVFWLDNQQKLVFTDQRHFGLMMVFRTGDLDEVEHLRKLAPEPFAPVFTDDYLFDRLRRGKQPIKPFLLDQTKVVGLGNIYASEVLHRAQIDPRVPANQISRRRTTILREKILEVLNEAIRLGGTLKTDSREVYGQYGAETYADNWFVYEREAQPCLTCSTPIQRFTQAGRSTYFCPRCQRR
ncbi:MAG TPA: bifunctional DNA-formamidopyrimidine glycosylase/DNA-(apurinic or apyrimidinic site) lyase [Blastocatellia bacterium]|nr:bifunctional DNA-formamidopyrimidine glycosylase/DNA-(apurinic or apyrimidinic site) lyase [Blastocatellia bacterium]